MKKRFLLLSTFIPCLIFSQINYFSNTISGAQNSSLGGYNAIYSGSGLGKTTSGSFISGYNNKIRYNSAGTTYKDESNSCFISGGWNSVGGQFSTAIGLRCLAGVGDYNSTSTILKSGCIAIGTNVTANATNAIAIGSGVWSGDNTFHTNDLKNTIDNSLMIGFNSNLPTLFVSGAVGPNTIGTVGIGTTQTKGHTLAVNGDIIATKVQVATYANWPDYVFDKDYKMMSLDTVERYITENHHLPNIPSAEDVKIQGFDFAEMNAALLQKTEELTLYLIEMKKENEKLKKQIETIQKQLDEQQK